MAITIANLNDHSFPCSLSGTFSSVWHQSSELVSFYAFNVFFDHPVVVMKDCLYRIEASIRGANSCFGVGGRESVLCSGVRFSFEGSSQSSNGTTVGRGQFPEFLFTVT